MKQVILIPDSFKGTMSSSRVCAIMRDAIHTHFPQCDIVSIPVADGGEGTVDCFLESVGGEKISCRVTGPLGGEIDSFYGILPDQTAVIEMAAAAGLPMVAGRENPLITTTFGVGQLMLDAVQRGCKNLIVGLGGSCTNDLGAGMAAAAGARFVNRDGQTFVPVGGTLNQIAGIDLSELQKRFDGVRVTAMCDIDNPLYGDDGAAKIFAPQKGATPEMVAHLDAQLRAAARVIERELGRDISNRPGAGAAGGMGAGIDAFFGAALQSGIRTVLDTVDYETRIDGADFIFTGEGKLDTQSLRGKVVIGVAQRTSCHAPVIAFVGDIGDNIAAAYDNGVSAIFSINRLAIDFATARLRCEQDLHLTVDNFARLIKRLTN